MRIAKWLYPIFTIAASVPIYFAINTYLRAIHSPEDEAMAVAATMVFMSAVYIGRHLTTVWSIRNKEVSRNVLNGLSIVVGVGIIWLFIYPSIQFEEYEAINLIFYWFPFVAVGLALGAWIKVFRLRTQTELEAAQRIAAHSQSELYLLQSQLSPHFLFNTLNNLYGLSITQHEKIPPLLLKLSDLLRYSVYEAGENFVPLKDELAYISNYIDFERLRIGDRLDLVTDIEQVSGDTLRIAPMLLIVFIENAFKHSKNTIAPHISIEIKIKIWGNAILFYIRNSYNRENAAASQMEKYTGFGLANVIKRLELLYPGQHELRMENDDTCYTVNLRLAFR